jgi:hypothetical protein
MAHFDEAALEHLFKVWQVKNQNTALYYGIAMFGLLAVFTITHWTGRIFDKSYDRSSSFELSLRLIGRYISYIFRQRNVAGIRVDPGRYSLAALYFAINIVLTFYDNPLQVTSLGFFAKRLGW